MWVVGGLSADHVLLHAACCWTCIMLRKHDRLVGTLSDALVEVRWRVKGGMEALSIMFIPSFLDRSCDDLSCRSCHIDSVRIFLYKVSHGTHHSIFSLDLF